MGSLTFGFMAMSIGSDQRRCEIGDGHRSRDTRPSGIRFGPAVALAVGLLPAVTRPADPPKPSRIYLFAQTPGQNGARGESAFYAVDPAAGTWVKVGGDVKPTPGAQARVSPDGCRLVYPETKLVQFTREERAKAGGVSGYSEPVALWEYDLIGDRGARRLGDFGGTPVWFPGGDRMILNRAKMPGANEAWRADADGRVADRLPLPPTDTVEDVTLDGTRVVTVSGRDFPEKGGFQVYTMGLDGKDQRQVTTGQSNVAPRLSPDGRRLIFIGRVDGKSRLRVMDLAGGEPRELDDPGGLDVTPDFPCWSPDGRSVAAVMKTWTRTPAGDLRIGRDGGNPRLALFDPDKPGVQAPRYLPGPTATNLGRPDWR
ncbi:MAG: TolB family protein [Isosphaeraceae bacterium]